MADGIKIYNDAGTIQIDESYFNLVLLDKVSGSISTPGTFPYPATNYSVTSDVACIAIQCTPGYFVISGSQFSSGTWTFRIEFPANGSGGTTNYTIFAFGLCPTPSETFGIHVKAASGATIFHSQFKPLRVQTVSAANGNYTAASGTNIACLILEPSAYAILGSFLEGNVLRCDGTQIEHVRSHIPGVAPTGTGRDGLYAAVDVTNY